MKKDISYNTKKRSEILNFIESNKDKHINVDEQKINKYMIDEKLGACYQCDDHDHHTDLLHLKCTNCNKLFHIDEANYKKANQQIKINQGFIIDPTKTILYGICSTCGGAHEQN